MKGKPEIRNPKPDIRSAGGEPSAPKRFLHAGLAKRLALAAGAVGAFHLAYFAPRGREPAAVVGLIVFLACLIALTGLNSPRRAFNYGVAIGLACYAPHLSFFWNLFGPASIALWMVLPIWLGVFLALATWARGRVPVAVAILLIPCLWTGVEYFRSELYPLKFSWLNLGYAPSPVGLAPLLHALGMYGIGFLFCAFAAAVALLWSVSWRKALLVVTLGCALALAWPVFISRAWIYSGPVVRVAGIQMEFPNEGAVVTGLNQLVQKYPTAEWLVLSEYTLDGPVPQRLKDWCRQHGKYLIVGGKEPAPGGKFYNTAFVLDPKGEIVFEQAKAVPIQFFNDGLPAPRQRVWESPWGKIGLCICYDLSYTRVTDELVRQGATALIVPTMDVESWGRYEHELHARVAPVRAAEYGLPIFRLASSGVSQVVEPSGRLQAMAPFPGPGEMIAAGIRTRWRPGLPADRFLAAPAMVLTAMVAFASAVDHFAKPKNGSNSTYQPVQLKDTP